MDDYLFESERGAMPDGRQGKLTERTAQKVFENRSGERVSKKTPLFIH
jgi:hypothetical protein